MSGPAAVVRRCVPLLEHTSTQVFEFGEDPGAANVVKICGNFLIAATIESLAESLALAECLGVDRKEVLTNNCGEPSLSCALFLVSIFNVFCFIPH